MQMLTQMLKYVTVVIKKGENTSRHTSAGDLPQYEAKAVNVCHDVGLKVAPVQSLVQNFRSHEAFGAHTCVQWDVHFISVAVPGDTTALI